MILALFDPDAGSADLFLLLSFLLLTVVGVISVVTTPRTPAAPAARYLQGVAWIATGLIALGLMFITG